MIRKIFSILSILTILIIGSSSDALSYESLHLDINNLDNLAYSCTTSAYWVFHPNENSEIANPEFDDSKGVLTQTVISYDDYENKKYGWFTLHMDIDSSLWNKEINLYCYLIGAIEIYLNDSLIYSKGTVGNSAESEYALFKINYHRPVHVFIKPKQSQHFAVKFSGFNTKLQLIPKITAGFLLAADLNKNAEQHSDEMLKKTISHQMFSTGLCFAFGLLHFLMFMFYRRVKANLYFALFTISCAVLSYAPVEFNLVSDLDRVEKMLFLFKLSLIGCSVFGIGVLYSIYYKKTPAFFKYLIIAGIGFMAIHSYLNLFIFYLITFLYFIEVFRVVIKSIKDKKEYAWIIGFGFIMFLVFSSLQMLNEFLDIPIWDMILQPYLIGIFSLMVSISAYIANSISTTNIRLERKLVEIEKLSEKTIAQEVSRKLLQKDIEHKEVQLQEAAKLEQTLEKLEEAHIKLQQADERTRSIIDASPVPLIVTRIDNGTILYANKHLGSLVGYTVEELEGQSSPDFYYDPNERQQVVNQLETHGMLDNHEVRIKHRDGRVIWCIFSLVASIVDDVKVIIGGLYDISQRKEAEEKLILYRKIFDSSQDGIMVFDTSGKMVLRNPAHKRLSGLTDEEVKGKQVLDLVPENARQAIRKGIEHGTFYRNEFEWPLPGGKERPIDLSVFTIPDSEGNVMYSVGMGRDISERRIAQQAMQKTLEKLEMANREIKQTQTQLIQSEKMASLGQLVAGVAHEINNPVGAMKSIHSTQVKAFTKLKEHLELVCALDKNNKVVLEKYLRIIGDSNKVISNGTERVSEIVRRLKSFARLDEAELQKIDINECVEDTLELIHHEIKNDVTVLKSCKDVPKISCYPGQLNQVLLNLLINAKHALEGNTEKGEIHIFTSYIDNRVLITIEDNGKGIPKENLGKIFDPGFTTKGVGVGTGLGLSICYQIIKEHHGDIKVESKVGYGTIFVIDLPTNLEELIEEK